MVLLSNFQRRSPAIGEKSLTGVGRVSDQTARTDHDATSNLFPPTGQRPTLLIPVVPPAIYDDRVYRVDLRRTPLAFG